MGSGTILQGLDDGSRITRLANHGSFGAGGRGNVDGICRSPRPVWTIQVLGRWESPVILGYVRDARLGQQGGHIAQVTERYTSSKSIDV